MSVCKHCAAACGLSHNSMCMSKKHQVWVSQQRRASQQHAGFTAGFTAACGLKHRSATCGLKHRSAACGLHSSFTTARELHSSTRASQQHASFTAARELHNGTRASQRHASFTTARELHNSTRASQQHMI